MPSSKANNTVFGPTHPSSPRLLYEHQKSPFEARYPLRLGTALLSSLPDLVLALYRILLDLATIKSPSLRHKFLCHNFLSFSDS